MVDYKSLYFRLTKKDGGRALITEHSETHQTVGYIWKSERILTPHTYGDASISSQRHFQSNSVPQTLSQCLSLTHTH